MIHINLWTQLSKDVSILEEKILQFLNDVVGRRRGVYCNEYLSSDVINLLLFIFFFALSTERTSE